MNTLDRVIITLMFVLVFVINIEQEHRIDQTNKAVALLAELVSKDVEMTLGNRKMQIDILDMMKDVEAWKEKMRAKRIISEDIVEDIMKDVVK